MASLVRGLSLLPLLALLLSACGSRSDLLDGAAGGAGGTGSTPSTTGTTTGTEPPACTALLVQSPFALPPTSGIASKTRTALLPPDDDVVISTLVTAPGEAAGLIVAGRLDAFSAWPPAFWEEAPIAFDVRDYEVGPGPEGPVALVRQTGVGVQLLSTWFPAPSWIDAPFNEVDRILFVTAIPGRYLHAGVYETPDYEVLQVGSYQPNNLPQNEQPLVCSKTPLLGAAIPSGQGFLAAFSEPENVDMLCVPDSPLSGGAAVLLRYDSPADFGASVKLSEGDRFTPAPGESLVHLGLAPASFGAWMVFQSDGGTSETPPPVFAAQVDAGGKWYTPFESYPVTPGGYIPPDVAVAALGDRLAVAWVDAIDPSAPVILVQLVEADGSLGPAVSIPTNSAWYWSDLRLLPSADGSKLLVSWSGLPDQGTAAVARVDCAQGP